MLNGHNVISIATFSPGSIEIDDAQISIKHLHSQLRLAILVKLLNFNQVTRRDSSVGRAED
jgi:hypothetical protein